MKDCEDKTGLVLSMKVTKTLSMFYILSILMLKEKNNIIKQLLQFSTTVFMCQQKYGPEF